MKGRRVVCSMSLHNTMLILVLLLSYSVSSLEDKTFQEYFEDGRRAYLANDWSECIKNVESALKKYKFYVESSNQCAENCRITMFDRDDMNNTDKLDEDYETFIGFFEKVIRKTLCTIKCKRKILKRFDEITPEIRDIFDKRETYDYLQLCYYKLGNLKHASDAAFTYLVQNPNSEVMRSNLNQYSKESDYKYEDSLKNRESPDYVSSFRTAVTALEEERHEDSIEAMETAIIEYIKAWKECRLSCEKPFDMGWFPDFITSVSNHFVFCLRCKHKCVEKLSNLDGDIRPDVYPLMYHYLQYSYYKIGDFRRAVESIESYLTLYEAQDMESNRKYFQGLSEVNESWFKPRIEAQMYYNVIFRENELLNFIRHEFVFDDDIDGDNQLQEPIPPWVNVKTEL